jgi:lipopolysaccharide/colanic/teichoic acid biosynthesis glycosyltransferase
MNGEMPLVGPRPDLPSGMVGFKVISILEVADRPLPNGGQRKKLGLTTMAFV